MRRKKVFIKKTISGCLAVMLLVTTNVNPISVIAGEVATSPQAKALAMPTLPQFPLLFPICPSRPTSTFSRVKPLMVRQEI